MSPPRPDRSSAPARLPSRMLTVLTGVVLGAVWGTIMWGIFSLAGNGGGFAGWIYVTLSVAMIGGGVAAIFGATGAVRRGERVTPRLFGRRRGR